MCFLPGPPFVVFLLLTALGQDMAVQEEELPEHEELGKKNKKSDNGNTNNTVALGIMPLQISLHN